MRMGDWSLGGGTIHCDGRQRGSAVILATQNIGPEPPGLVLATAAHVLFDLEAGRLFEHCSFHYLGLDALPGYQAEIDLSTASLGRFNPDEPLESWQFGQQDWAFLHVPASIPAAGHGMRIRPVAWDALVQNSDSGIPARLLAWSVRHSAISLSVDCHAAESRPGDLGGGTWPGQLLDDCDSGQGASGGGLLATLGQEVVLVGIRTGSHWDASIYPTARFPDGPPPGARWDVMSNTNFARAIDGGLISALRAFLIRLQQDRSG